MYTGSNVNSFTFQAQGRNQRKRRKEMIGGKRNLFTFCNDNLMKPQSTVTFHKPLSPVTGQTQTTVTSYRADTNHCHRLQDRHKPLSPVTGQTQSTVTGYRTDTIHCHLLQGRHKPLSPVTGQTQTNVTCYTADINQGHRLQGRDKPMKPVAGHAHTHTHTHTHT